MSDDRKADLIEIIQQDRKKAHGGARSPKQGAA
jgi:hypothetical protein